MITEDKYSDLEIASGRVDGVKHINKYGSELVAAAGVADVDIVGDGNLVYVPPVANRPHKVKSDNAADVGTLIGTYGSTTFDQNKLIDTGATFIADGVSAGDVLVNDTNQDHSLVISVDSETQLTIEPWHHSKEENTGDVFRIASPASTGAVFVHIKEASQKDGTLLTEFILLNGITDVSTVNSYYRMTRAHIHGAGSSKSNVGKITITADTELTVTAIISPKKGNTLMAFYHVPLGKVGYITGLNASMFRATKVTNAMADMQLMSNLWGADGQTVLHPFGLGAAGGAIDIEFKPYKKISQGTDVWMRSIETTDAASKITAGFNIILEDIK